MAAANIFKFKSCENVFMVLRSAEIKMKVQHATYYKIFPHYKYSKLPF